MAAENSTIPGLDPIVQNTITGAEILPVSQGVNDLGMRIDQIPHDLTYQEAGSDKQHLTTLQKEALLVAKGITIGTGGDYPNIGAAVTAGAINSNSSGLLHTNIEFVSDVIETGDVLFPNTSPIINQATTISIKGNGYKWNLGNYAFTRTTFGNGTLINAFNVNIITAKTSAGSNISTNVLLHAYDSTLDLRSNTLGYFQSYSSTVICNSCNILLANIADGGLYQANQSLKGKLAGSDVIGAGSSCTLNLGSSSQSGNNSFSGTFSSTAQSGLRSDGFFSNNIVSITGMFSAIAGNVNNNSITASAGITFYTAVSSISNNKLNSAVAYGGGGAATHFLAFVNNRFASTFAPDRPTHCIGNYFNGAVTSTSNFHGIGNVFTSTFSSSNVLILHANRFDVNVTITGAGTSKIISGNIQGDGASGGGAATITLGAGVNRAIIKENQLDNAIIDNSGSGTNIIADNIIY